MVNTWVIFAHYRIVLTALRAVWPHETIRCWREYRREQLFVLGRLCWSWMFWNRGAVTISLYPFTGSHSITVSVVFVYFETMVSRKNRPSSREPWMSTSNRIFHIQTRMWLLSSCLEYFLGLTIFCFCFRSTQIHFSCLRSMHRIFLCPSYHCPRR